LAAAVGLECGAAEEAVVFERGEQLRDGCGRDGCSSGEFSADDLSVGDCLKRQVVGDG
jgi:hypothetical protein